MENTSFPFGKGNHPPMLDFPLRKGSNPTMPSYNLWGRFCVSMWSLLTSIGINYDRNMLTLWDTCKNVTSGTCYSKLNKLLEHSITGFYCYMLLNPVIIYMKIYTTSYFLHNTNLFYNLVSDMNFSSCFWLSKSCCFVVSDLFLLAFCLNCLHLCPPNPPTPFVTAGQGEAD